jgi:hypothetical protein
MTKFHSSSPLYICTTFYLPSHHLLNTSCLGWFHILPIVNCASVNMGVQVSLLYVDLHSFRYAQEKKDLMVVLFLVSRDSRSDWCEV